MGGGCPSWGEMFQRIKILFVFHDKSARLCDE